MILSFIRLFERKILFMKKTKILVPAMAVLALGMAASVTGTVAWFSMNTQVMADGMTLKSVTSKSLMISLEELSGYGTVVSMVASKPSVLPVSPVDSSASVAQSTTGTTVAAEPEFIRVNIDANPVVNPASSAATKTIAEAYEANKVGSTSGESGDWYLKDDYANVARDDFYLLYTEGEGLTSGVNLKIVCSRTGDFLLDDAFRVGLYDGVAGKMYTWAPWAGEVTGTSVEITASAFVTLTSGTPYKYTAYSWIEGTDANCTTQNSLNVQNLNTSFVWNLA